MRRWVLVAVLVLAVGCSSGGDAKDAGDGTTTTAPSGFYQQWKDVPAGPAYKGHPTRIDESEKVLYIDDCILAREATAQEGPYGPKQQANGDYSEGYGYICP